ncbi:MAG: cache domain-containing protein [Proteobacteria bacterium]|nr:cache domain-containing protein [Pseudomonadota bacterium]
MKKILVVIVMCMFLMGVVGEVIAAGTAADAEAMVKKAVEYIKANGKDKAYGEFTKNQTGMFKKDDLYIFVLDDKYNMLAHGGNDKMVGKNFKDLKDSDGSFFLKGMVDKGMADGKAWYDYKWTNPVTKKVEPKSSYVVKVDNTVVGCGFYKK